MPRRRGGEGRLALGGAARGRAGRFSHSRAAHPHGGMAGAVSDALQRRRAAGRQHRAGHPRPRCTMRLTTWPPVRRTMAGGMRQGGARAEVRPRTAPCGRRAAAAQELKRPRALTGARRGTGRGGVGGQMHQSMGRRRSHLRPRGGQRANQPRAHLQRLPLVTPGAAVPLINAQPRRWGHETAAPARVRRGASQTAQRTRFVRQRPRSEPLPRAGVLAPGAKSAFPERPARPPPADNAVLPDQWRLPLAWCHRRAFRQSRAKEASRAGIWCPARGDLELHGAPTQPSPLFAVQARACSNWLPRGPQQAVIHRLQHA